MNEDGAQAAMEEERLRAILESLLFAAGEPVTLTQLANALDNIPREEIRKALAAMASEYAASGRGIVLEEVAGGYQLRTPKEHAVYVRRLLAAKPPRLSRPLLETLAIVAYRQPITRSEIEQLRGVDTGGVLDTLTERGLIRISGRKDAPGRPIMYSTTPEFLELFGLKDIESLPDLEEFRAVEGMIDRASARIQESQAAETHGGAEAGVESNRSGDARQGPIREVTSETEVIGIPAEAAERVQENTIRQESPDEAESAVTDAASDERLTEPSGLAGDLASDSPEPQPQSDQEDPKDSE